MACGQTGVHGPIARKPVTVENIIARVHAQTQSLRTMEGIALDQMRMMIFVTFNPVQVSV